jgi:NAD(P)-dependent dehydrogenase (short-subunit alcohol dehydrogenase family)
MNLLQSKVALITGAARGIGKATMDLFAQNGAIIYANDVREELLQEGVREVSEK